MKKKIIAASLLAILPMLSACSGRVDNSMPIGVGTGPNSLKLSPCASAADSINRAPGHNIEKTA